MAVVIASGREAAESGTIRWAIESNRGNMDLLTQSTQNAIIREALTQAGQGWIAAFLPKRFGDYVSHPPFPYDIPRRDGFYLNKARRMGLLAPVCQRLFNGWDPWSSNRPGPALIETWKRQHPGKYKRSITGQYSGLIADLRRSAKAMVMQQVNQWFRDNVFVELVESGALQASSQNARATATATSSRQQIRIAVPFPGPRNPRVGDTIRTIPRWEVAYIARVVKASIAQAAGQKAGVVRGRASRKAFVLSMRQARAAARNQARAGRLARRSFKGAQANARAAARVAATPFRRVG